MASNLPSYDQAVEKKPQDKLNNNADENQALQLSISGRASGDDTVTALVTVSPPAGRVRTSSDIVCVVDVSGSMQLPAEMMNDEGNMESHGLNLLDIVKHAVNTIIETLSPEDRLSVVSYSTEAKVVVGLTKMDKAGKNKARDLLQKLQPDSQTNLWAGLHLGMEQLQNNNNNNDDTNRLGSVLILTDGQPNIEPPRGHIPMLQKYLKRHSDKVFKVDTFGFGYNLNSKLLEDIACEGNGMYSFIPDAGFVGTAFVHAASNILATATQRATIQLDLADGVQLVQAGGNNYPRPEVGNALSLELGPVVHGQAKHIPMQLKLGDKAKGMDGALLTASLSYEDRQEGPVMTEAKLVMEDGGAPDAATLELMEVQRLRILFCETVKKAVAVYHKGELDKAQAIVKELVGACNESPAAKHEHVDALRQDAEGQVTQAMSRKDWFKRWGRHYLPSLVRSHTLQQCSNFKDPGLQVYGGQLFSDIRDEVDELFCKLPPPKPAPVNQAAFGGYGRGGGRGSANAPARRRQPINMAVYNNRHGGCFGANTAIRMADGSTRAVQDLRRGDRVTTTDASHAASVVCVTRSTGGDSGLVQLLSGLVITAYHPVRDGAQNTWNFPLNVEGAQPYSKAKDEYVYNLVLDQGHEVVADGVQAITLGHGIQGDAVASHPYFGSQRIVDDLRAMRGWEEGMVTHAGSVRVDGESGLVCGLTQ